MDDLVVFTYNNGLDAMGCLLAINECFDDSQYNKHLFYTNYRDIPEELEKIKTQCDIKKPKFVIICDISFAENNLELHRFYEYCEQNTIKILFFDHHLYPKDFFKTFTNIKSFWDKDKCSAKIIKDLLLPKCENVYFNKIIDIIDVFDTWQDEHKWFDFSQKFNNYFSHLIKNNHSIKQIAEGFKERNYTLPDDFMSVTNILESEQEEHLETVENSGLVHRNIDAKVTLYFSNYHFNSFMINEHRNGQMFVINICNWGLIKVRINKDVQLDIHALNMIRLQCTGLVHTGHELAFTWVSDLDFVIFAQDSLINEAKRITKIIDNVITKRNTIIYDEDIPF